MKIRIEIRDTMNDHECATDARLAVDWPERPAAPRFYVVVNGQRLDSTEFDDRRDAEEAVVAYQEYIKFQMTRQSNLCR